jgi:cobalt-zinc-cadmium efflux system outer membrane protein
MALIRWSFCTVSLMVLVGCSYLGSQVDREVSELAAQVQRVESHPAYDEVLPTAATVKPVPEKAPNPKDGSGALPPPQQVPDTQPGQDEPVHTIALLQPDKPQPEKKTPRLVVPPALPGSDAPPLQDFERADPRRKKYIAELYPPLPLAPKLALAAPGPEGRPMTLADLQRLAAIYSPAIKSAEAAVEAAKGAAKQAGAYPNPAMFFEQDTVGTGPAGYEGFGFHQTVKTGNKLKLLQAAATMDLLNAQLALKRAYTDLAYQVRTNYFAVLVALETVKINEALYQFTSEVFRIQLDLIKDTAAIYEPLQLRALALQARFTLVQAQNQYLASWRQLAATLGLRDMPPTELVGRVDMPVPVFEYNDVRARVLANHTDVRTAYFSIEKAKFNLELARITPVPDVDLNVLAQKDTTAPHNQIVHSLQVSVPVPIFDQNLGAIKQAEGLLMQANAGPDQARNNLTLSLADAFNRYKTGIENVDIAMQQTRDQLRAYRALHARYFRGGPQLGFGFSDVVTAQQTLAGYIASYVAALGAQWLAVNDIANLLQTDDLFGVGPKKDMLPVPDLKQLGPPHGLPSCLSSTAAGAPLTGNLPRPE